MRQDNYILPYIVHILLDLVCCLRIPMPTIGTHNYCDYSVALMLMYYVLGACLPLLFVCIYSVKQTL